VLARAAHDVILRARAVSRGRRSRYRGYS
jgi:hypothetical protein